MAAVDLALRKLPRCYGSPALKYKCLAGRFCKLVEQSPRAIDVIAGCSSQRYGKRILNLASERSVPVVELVAVDAIAVAPILLLTADCIDVHTRAPPCCVAAVVIGCRDQEYCYMLCLIGGRV